MDINYYVRKPLVVEAVKVTEETLYDVAKWCNGEVRTVDGERIINVDVLHFVNRAQTIAKPGMWILRSTQGYKIFTDRAFSRGFELAEVVGNSLDEEIREGLKQIKES